MDAIQWRRCGEKTRQDIGSAVVELVDKSLDKPAAAVVRILNGILAPSPPLVAAPPVITASAVFTASTIRAAPSFRYVIRVQEPPPLYSRTPSSIVPSVQGRMNVLHGKNPFVASRLVKITTFPDPSHCSAVCFPHPIRVFFFSCKTDSLASTAVPASAGESTPGEKVSPED